MAVSISDSGSMMNITREEFQRQLEEAREQVRAELQPQLEEARKGWAEARQALQEDQRARAALERAVLILCEQQRSALTQERCDLLARFHSCSAQACAAWLA